MFKWLGNFFKWLRELFVRDSNEKELQKQQSIIDKINSLEPEFQKLSDEGLRAKTGEFSTRIAASTAGIREELTKVRAELDEAKQEQFSAKEGFDKASADAHRKDLEERITGLEKERQDVEANSLNELMPEAFAAVREASRRKTGQRHFDSQLRGGIALHQGRIAEMKTGEGKTLVATLPLYLNALVGEGVHLATVNDYLSRRDPYWMGPIYHALGLTVASIYPQQVNDPDHTPARVYDPAYDSGKEKDQWRHFRPITRKEAYQADITYGTNSEFGFDYLRDNMVVDLNQCVQRPLNYAIVDEADNLLIDEARTPLIISGPSAEPEQTYHVFSALVPRLQNEKDYTVDEKTRGVTLTDEGIERVEEMLRRDGVLKSGSIYDPSNNQLTRYLDNALKAQVIFKKDKDYVVQNGEIIIVDEFTGRLMIGRRYSEGLHQAIEAKERVKVQQETMTYATVTIQNYFRMYRKLGGMTGTAVTEAEEFHKIYKLEVVVIPTNKPMVRQDLTDQIYKDEDTKFKAVVNQVEEVHKTGRPVLLGTVSIEKSEKLSDMLKRKGILHQDVLNAKLQQVKEAGIVAEAGKEGAVTVATNMAGRGVDIVLGGKPPDRPETNDPDAAKEYEKEYSKWKEAHDRIISLGGLYVIGTERHEARRIDNQLRGRAGRQGDPGTSRFFVSLDDDIVRRFGGDRIKGIMTWAGMDEDTPIENKLVSRTIENAQVKVEGYNFDIRKHLVDYDDVVNNHRKVIYEERRKVLAGIDLKANILKMIGDEIGTIVESHASHNADQESDFAAILTEANSIFPIPPTATVEAISGMKPEEIRDMLIDEVTAQYDRWEQQIDAAVAEYKINDFSARKIEQRVVLVAIDKHWIDHLTAMENLREGIGLQAIAQRDPLVAYKREGQEYFRELKDNIRNEVVHNIFHVQIVRQETPKQQESPMAKVAAGNAPKVAAKADGRKVGRNDPCPCGSGKKYKNCHGK